MNNNAAIAMPEKDTTCQRYSPAAPLRIVFLCGEKESYPRNDFILKALRSSFKTYPIISNKGSYALRIPEVLLRFLWLSFFKAYDAVYVGFLGQPFVPLIRLFTRKPLILDAFVSIYDVLCLDRKDFSSVSLIGKIAFWLDAVSFSLADKIITDTNANADFFSHVFKIPRSKFATLYADVDENTFYPQEIKKNTALYTIFFHGTFWKLHGIEYIVKAAKLLENERDIIFKIVGGGREKKKILKLVQELNIKNIEFLNWVSYKDLTCRIAEADICLGGHFSNAEKAKRVISGKTFMYLAMQKPTIVGDNPTTKELFTHLRDTYLCAMADAHALAEAIKILKGNKKLREHIAQEGLATFKNLQTKEKLKAIIETL